MPFTPTPAAPRPAPQLPKLREFDPRFTNVPLVVSCAVCEMTMWANSDSALVDTDGSIVCPSCAPAPSIEG